MRIIALTTCYNRKDTTLHCLKSLFDQKFSEKYNLDVCLVDDGSADGTGQAVKNKFPEVTVLNGNGNLYWGGGMCFGWNNFVKQQNFNYLLAFNDDVTLYPNALEVILNAAESLEEEGIKNYAVSGAFRNDKNGEISYGGVVKKYWWHPVKFKKISPNGRIQECFTLNMNCALISKSALDLVGFLSPEFTHKAGDFDFGLRLRKTGGKVVLAREYVGVCSLNSDKGTAKEADISFIQRCKRYFSVKGQHPKFRALYLKRHAGVFWPFYFCASYLGLPFKLFKVLFFNKVKDEFDS